MSFPLFFAMRTALRFSTFFDEGVAIFLLAVRALFQEISAAGRVLLNAVATCDPLLHKWVDDRVSHRFAAKCLHRQIPL